MQIKQYSGTMLRSRAVSGKYEAFLSESDLVSTDALENADYIILDAPIAHQKARKLSEWSFMILTRFLMNSH